MKSQFLPGMRIIKTVIAIFITLIITRLLNYDVPIQAAIACVIVMKTTPKQSYRTSIHRLHGTLLGGIISLGTIQLLTLFNFQHQPYPSIVMFTLAAGLGLYMCKLFQWPEYVASMTGIVILVTLLTFSTSNSSALVYVINRMAETLIGVVIASLVNRYIGFKNDTPS